MQYDIRLTLTQNYPGASDHVRNLLRLMPLDGKGQRLLGGTLTLDPAPDERRDGVDFFGNATTLVGWHRPVERIAATLAARAARLAAPDPGPTPALQDLGAAIAARGGLDASSPLHFRSPSPRIADSQVIVDFARAAVAPDMPAAKAVAALGQAVHARIAFRAGVTDAATRPEAAFLAGHGVCQDMAQIMIAGLRALGVPAGYVSGFLRTEPPPGQPRLEGVDAMHGWVMAWVGGTDRDASGGGGWVEYDPTNARWAGQDYIAVARGRDYADAAPVHGALRSAGAQTSGHAVDVVPLDPDAAPD